MWSSSISGLKLKVRVIERSKKALFKGRNLNESRIKLAENRNGLINTESKLVVAQWAGIGKICERY